MAESVHFYLEQMLPELQDLQRKGLFSPAEVKSIVKKRTEFEYALKKRINKKVDYLRYIEYEMNLETLRKKRRARGGSKTGPSDFAGPKRIHFIFKRALKKFPGDINLWVQYIQYAQRIKSYKSLGQIFARALQLHPHNHKLWILAADYENTTNANTSGARVLLQRALRLNPESTDLWLSYFTLEMNWVDKVRERRRVLLGEKDDHLKLYGSESDDQQSENDDDAALSGSDAERDEHTKV
ncbi:U3 small nucleolar RNA-associated protein 6-domain-containing protein [Paraphysoderma sedebokerense]|nr:U3 small nucleolar RNA-associated protein 6-domain-containing protein [Paraphysoderma sedebokerense]